MTRSIFALMCFCSFLSFSILNAQTLTPNLCDDRLDEAKRSYQAGQLSKVEEKISDCLNDRVFKSRVKLEDGFKLLTESYLFQDKIAEATISFEELLTINPLFEADSTDPNNSYDMIYLSRTYRRKPIVSIYGTAGINYTLLEVLQNYNADNNNRTAEDYMQFTLGYSAAFGVEVPIWRDFTLAVEANFASRAYRYLDTLFMSSALENPDQRELIYGTLQFRESQLWIDIPVMFRYEHYFKQKKLKWVIPYAFVGAAPNFLLASNFVNIQRNTSREPTGGGAVVGGERTVTVAGIGLTRDDPNALSLRNSFNVSVLAGLGAKFRAGRNFVVVEARYNRFMLNSVNRQNRYSNNELVFEYGYVDNDFRIDNFALTIGFEKSFYKPRKKRRYDPVHVNNKLEKIIRREKSNAKRTTDAELKRELNSYLRELERDKPGILEDVRRGRASSTVIREATDELNEIKGN
jgi:hypothetical protein